MDRRPEKTARRRSPLRPWLGTVLINGLRNRARADRRRGRRKQVAHELGAPDPVPTPEELTARLELQRQWPSGS